MINVLCIIFSVASILMCSLALVVAFYGRKQLVKRIEFLEKQNETLKRHNRYQQKQIEGLREHNGNLYDENLGLKCTMVMQNIPDLSDEW